MNESHFKAADDDRGAVVDKLAKAHAEGRLSQAEFDERSRAAREARSYAELHQLTADLPGSGGRTSAPSQSSAPTPPPGRPEPEWQSRPLPVRGETAAGPVWRSTPVGEPAPGDRQANGDRRAADAHPAPEWQDASGNGGRNEPVDEPAPVWQDASQASAPSHGAPSRNSSSYGASSSGASSSGAPRGAHPGNARSHNASAGARIGPDAHADSDYDHGADTGYGPDTGYAPQRQRREPPPVPQKRSRATVFLTVLTAVWFFASGINLLIWGIINGTSDTSIYPWWLWVAGPLGVVVLTAHLVRFGMRR
ncbi:DUF1707 domain-containing protein [Saccharothrix xinjiangensis]|uniref:DUF1707 domain-containing protein n=1 Tax=Saccharothrix xinjiangensis TaxID=204798 RepID=A0ABV9Y8B0_9PSEU